MNFELLPMAQADIAAFKRDIQEAFQKGFEDVYGKTEDTILPEEFIGDGGDGMFVFQKQM